MLARPKPWCTPPPLGRPATPLAVCALLSLLLSADAHARSLTFEERVAAQRAIEQVYWNHRIWPKDNPGPKPDLSAVMPEAAIRARVEDYLRKSNALEKWWQRPITAAELQAEMDRMARDTRDPKVLHELFDALENDPGLIAETLVRQTLADTRVRSAYANDARFHGEVRRRAEAALAGCRSVDCMKAMGGKYRETTWELRSENPNERLGARPGELQADEWKAHLTHLAETLGGTLESLPVLVPGALEETDEALSVTAVLSQGGAEITTATVVWPKVPFDAWWSEERKTIPARLEEASGNFELDAHFITGAIASASIVCEFPTWTATSVEGSVPEARTRHTAIWTGSEMIIWGGRSPTAPYDNLITGARYNPSTDTWSATSITGIPIPFGRSFHTAVWTGTSMIVWGGVNDVGVTNIGERYDPTTDTWMTTSTGAGTPSGRTEHTAVWTGTEMIIWGGRGDASLSRFDTGGRYNPSTNSWTPTSSGPNLPRARDSHTAVWSGTEMIVWGGDVDFGADAGTGGRYDPASNTWAETSTGAGDPTGRVDHTAVWTGTEMIVWGGRAYEFFQSVFVNSGGHYNPSSDSWTPTNTDRAPYARSRHSVIWTGSKMYVWGGASGADGYHFNSYWDSGGAYVPLTRKWDGPTPRGGACPSRRLGHTAVWAEPQMIIWGGVGTSAYQLSDLAPLTGGSFCACSHRYYRDADGDGYGNFADPATACSIPAGYVDNNSDCNDADPLVHSPTAEVCNGIDDDCDGQIDEGLPLVYRDTDQDGYGNLLLPSCYLLPGFVSNSSDCDDTNPNIHPGVAEVCNGIDDDCDGQIDEGVPIVYRDADQDGYGNLLLPSCYLLPGFVPNSSDCDDSNPNINPGVAEICNDIDDDCDGQIDEGVRLYRDADQDGYGNPLLPSCYLLPGFVHNSTDCDDSNPNIHPGAVEVCNGYDDDCNGLVDDAAGAPTVYYDWDGDGYGDPATAHPRCTLGASEVTIAGDCNDNDFSIRPGVPDETCNGIDDNCSGHVDEVFPPCQCARRGQDLKGWWPGEGTAVDLNLANNGTLMGAITFDAGKVGQAFVFDGASWVVLPDGPALENIWVTLEAWIRPDSPAAFSGLGRIISKFGTAGNRAYQFGLESGGALRGEVSGDGTASVVLVSPPGLLSVGTWAHVAMTFNQTSTYGTLKLFINGNEVCSATPPFTTIFTGGSSLPNIGRDPVGGNYFVGLIDEATITGRALQDGEIKAIYNAGVNGMCQCIDQDNDGYGRDGGVSCPNGTLRDCNDSAPQIYPGRGEICNGLDDDCDGQIDEGLSCFAEAVSLPGVFNSSVAWGDYDNDGDLDILLTGLSSIGPVSKVYRNNGGANPTFTDVLATLTGVSSSSAAWGDYDKDGDLDIALAGTDAANAGIAKIYQNNGGAFSAIAAGLTGVKVPSLAWGDFDNDGDLDLLVTGSTNGSASGALTRLYRNQGFGNFTAYSTSIPAVFWSSVAWADYDNDGDLDVLVAGTDATSTLIARVYRSGGGTNPIFALASGLAGCFAGSAAWGDFDNDGDFDPLIASGNASGHSQSALYRNAPPIFFDTGVNLTGVDYSSAVWGDYNNDGKIDIFLCGVTNFGNDQVSKIYRNDVLGMGVAFTDPGAAGLPQVASSSAAWGDYDNDGDLDLLVTGTTNGLLSGAVAKVIRNLHGGAPNAPPSAPAGLNASLVGGTTVAFTWNASSDDRTPAVALTYNLRIGSTPGGSQISSPMANSVNGYRRIPALGNAYQGLSSSVTLPLPTFPSYYWSVQAVDGGFAGSPFAPEQSFNLAVLGVGDGPETPTQFALGGSSPNPFATSTTLTYDLPRAERVRLEVFDLNGRRVRTLVSEFMEAGHHRAVWDGTDELGRRVPAGLYLYRMLAGSFRATGRTVMMP